MLKPPNRRVMNFASIAKLLKCHPETIRRWYRQERLPFDPLPRSALSRAATCFAADEVERWIADGCPIKEPRKRSR